MSFATLEQDEQVARLARLAGRAVAAWDFPAPRVALLKYRENAVFAVTAADGRRGVMRVHRPGYRSDLDIRSEIAWMRALAVATRWQRPQPFSRPSWDAETLVGERPAFGPFWELPALDDAQRDVALAARDRVRARLAALGPADALIHGDLVPDNLL
ncbi:MAG: hypothetical protein NTZ61_13090, partial [Proteobacteria bacterium]|nr:hypothetical protein [Pseudomonadota bacterium]